MPRTIISWIPGSSSASTRQQPPTTTAPSLTQSGTSSSSADPAPGPAPAQPDPDCQVSPVLGYTTKGTPGQALLASCSAPVIMLGAEQLNPTAITFPSLQ